MPVHYHLDQAKRRLNVATTGEISLAELLGVLDRQAGDGAWSWPALFDARESSGHRTADDLRQLILKVGTLTTSYGPRGPVAMIAGSVEVERFARAYASVGALTAMNVRVFTTSADAERWLAEAGDE